MTSPTTVGGDTSSWQALKTTIRRGLIGFQDPTVGRQIPDLLGKEPECRLFVDRAPDDTAFPYAVMRLSAMNDGGYAGLRLVGQLEVQIYGKPWTMGDSLVEPAADLMEQAMWSFLVNTDGLVYCHAKDRATLEPGASPADSEVYTVRLVFTLTIWPDYLTRLTQTAS